MTEDPPESLEQIKQLRETVSEIIEEIRKLAIGDSIFPANEGRKWDSIKELYYIRLRSAFLLEKELDNRGHNGNKEQKNKKTHS